MITYRAVKANDSNEVIAIGYDENQSGIDYHGQGLWLGWTFDIIPDVDADAKSYADSKDFNGSFLKVDNGVIVSKTQTDLINEGV